MWLEFQIWNFLMGLLYPAGRPLMYMYKMYKKVLCSGSHSAWAMNEWSFKSSLWNQSVLGLVAYGPKKGISMWALGTQFQNGLSQ